LPGVQKQPAAEITLRACGSAARVSIESTLSSVDYVQGDEMAAKTVTANAPGARTGKRPSAQAGQPQEQKPTMARTTIDLGEIDDLSILNQHGEVDDALDPKLPAEELK